MSAEAFPVYNTWCADCATGDGPHDYLDDAEAWAAQHNADYHEDAAE